MLDKIHFLSSGKKTLIIICYDFFAAALSFYLSLVLRFGSFEIPSLTNEELLLKVMLVSGTQYLIFYAMGLYKGIWRFSSTPDLVRILKAVTLACLVTNFILFQVARLENIPRSTFIIDWLLLIVSLGGGRFAFRLINDGTANFTRPKALEKVLIIGAGISGERLARDIRKRQNKGLSYNLLGFIDDNPGLWHKKLQDIPVLGPTTKLSQIVEKTGAKKIFIAIPYATSSEIKKILGRIKGLDIVVKTLPKIGDFIEGQNQLAQLRSLSIEDLLGRESVKLDEDSVSGMIYQKIVMVTGAGGSIGSELCAQIAKFSPKQIICYEQSEYALYKLEKDLKQGFPDLCVTSVIGDVRNLERSRSIVAKFRPEILLHAAAYKHVPIMEENPYEAVKTNILGTKIMAELAKEFEVEKFVLVSTDKAVNPSNIMGTTKRVAEILCSLIASERPKTKFMTVRFGNVLGSSGSVIPLFQDQLAKGGPLTVTHREITRYFMSIPEASQLVLQAAALGKGQEVFVLDMGEPVKIYDLAKQMILLAGLRPFDDIDIEVTGLRPGEKLYEELLTPEESSSKTDHPKILIAQSFVHGPSLLHLISRVISMTNDNPVDEYREVLKMIVPEYKWRGCAVRDGDAITGVTEVEQSAKVH